jgi:hypothetical protein
LSGVKDKMGNPQPFKDSFATGSRQGRPAGVKAGNKWIANIKIEVE